MAREVVLQRAARRDLEQIGDYLAEQSLKTAQRFADDVAATVSRIGDNPELGSPLELDVPGLDEVRFWRPKRFNKYLIFYVTDADRVRVLRVLHGARDIESLLGGEAG